MITRINHEHRMQLWIFAGALLAGMSAGAFTVETNLGMQAAATASSVSRGQQPAGAIDGIVGGYPDHPESEWASNRQGAGAWLQLDWPQPVTFNEIHLYDRVTPRDQILAARAVFDDGSSVMLLNPANDGSVPAKAVFPAVTSKTLRIEMVDVGAETRNVGLAEVVVLSTATQGVGAFLKNARRPNILFMLSDDHALKALSAYDGALIETPNLDRLAAGGMVFENAFVPNSICGPSRAAILTGKHSHKNGYLGNMGYRFNTAQWTVARALQSAGYQTACIGKWHLAGGPKGTGFDDWQVLPGQGDYYNPDFLTPEGTITENGYVSDIITDRSIDWLRKRDESKPFFLWIGHKAPHRNWMAGPDDLQAFEDHEFTLPETFHDDYSGRVSGALEKNTQRIDAQLEPVYDLKAAAAPPGTPGFHARLQEEMDRKLKRMNADQRAAWDRVYADAPVLTDPQQRYQRYMREYSKTIRGLDRDVGRLLDFLEDEGLMENTLIVYCSDQGFFLGEHGLFDKRWMYEETQHTPLLARLPGTVPAGKSEDLVMTMDLTATWLDLAGVPVPADLNGRSLLPLWSTPGSEWRDAVYYHYYENRGFHRVPRHDGIRTDRYKLICFYDLGRYELYDLQTDPREMNNLAEQAEYKPLQKRLMLQLEQMRKELDVPEAGNE